MHTFPIVGIRAKPAERLEAEGVYPEPRAAPVETLGRMRCYNQSGCIVLRSSVHITLVVRKLNQQPSSSPTLRALCITP